VQTTQAVSSRLYFRTEPLGTVQIDSPHPPAVVLNNLRQRGREWRESAIPDDLRQVKAGNLGVEIDGSGFKLRWGAANPFYNPVCFGTVQPYGAGSRIRAGFKMDLKALQIFWLFGASALLAALVNGGAFNWAMLAFMVILVITLWARRQTSEPMRTRLIEVLNASASGDRSP